MKMNKFKMSLLATIPAVALLLIPAFQAIADMGQKTIVLENAVSNSLDMQFNVTEPEQQTTPPVTSEEVTIIVDMGDGQGVSEAVINRITNADGSKRDEVTFQAEQATQAVEKGKQSGRTTARIVIPDSKDEVSQLDLNIPSESLESLASGGMDLEIYTDNGKIVIPNRSLQGLVGNLYFKVVPIKDESKRNEVEERARIEEVVKEVAGENDIEVVARPMTIETNLSSREVNIVLPLLHVTLPTDEQEREAFLADLVIFIEHSDGDRKLVKPEFVEYSDGQLGLQFGINKFSTFTILNMEGWGTFVQGEEETNTHDAYVAGYPDMTFKPDQGLSRAEMAAILYRLEAGATRDNGNPMVFSDVAVSHWAQSAIRYVSSKGLMVGLPDGTFKPEQSITRAEMTTIVSDWLALHGDDWMTTFEDANGHWAEKTIALVQQADYVQGLPDGLFHPDRGLTRAEAVTIMNKILKRGSQDWMTSTWSDVPNTHWALKDIEEASRSHEYELNQEGLESIVE